MPQRNSTLQHNDKNRKGAKRQFRNVQLLEKGHKNDAEARASPDTVMIVESQLCGLLTFASVPAKYSDLELLYSAAVHER